MIVPGSGFLPLPINAQVTTLPTLIPRFPRLWQIPAGLQITSADIEVALLWFRDTAAASQALIHVSISGLQFLFLGSESQYASGGTLRDAFDTTMMSPGDEITQGPTFQVVGPDIGRVQDLQGDEAAFNAGQQLAIIGNEVFFLKGVVALTPELYRLEGLKVGQYQTTGENHQIGDPVYILPNSSWNSQVNDSQFQPGQEINVKVQVIGAGQVQGLEEIEPFFFTPSIILPVTAFQEQGASHTYNDEGQIIRSDFENGDFKEYAYDDQGRVSSITTPSASFAFGYEGDSHRLLTKTRML